MKERKLEPKVGRGEGRGSKLWSGTMWESGVLVKD